MTSVADAPAVYLAVQDLPDDLVGDVECGHYPHGAEGAACELPATLQVLDNEGPVYVCRRHALVVTVALLSEQLA